MKKFLPKTTNNSQAFTLIELMVVIAIIAILTVVGISIYSNVQKSARDGVRRAEVNSLANSIESSKDPVQQKYSYTATNYASDFPNNKPADPLKDSAGPMYCVATSTTTTVPADPTTWAATSNCPTAPGGWAYIVNNTSAYNATVGTNALNNAVTAAAAARSWKVCARMEGTGSWFCQTNSQ